jgi:VCBS repeat-containing protein
VTLSTTKVTATDPDSKTLTYTLSEVVGGQFIVNGKTSDTFTQTQLASGLVQFQHDGSEAEPSYTITVSDGELTDTELATGTRTPVNDLPTFTANSFVITEGVTLPVDTSVLNAFDVDPQTPGADLKFTVSNLTAGASFTVNGTPGVTTFNRQDILDGVVSFFYDGETAPSFTLKVEDDRGGSTTQAAKVTFTPVNDAPTFTGTLTPLTVSEGGTVTLSTKNVDATDPDSTIATLTFTASSVTGGKFIVNGTLGDTFTRSQLASSLVRFQHDGSNTIPSYTLTVSDGEASSTKDFNANILNLTNDVPVVKANQITLSEGDTITLTQDNILITDEPGESTPAQITIFVDTVTNGKFLLSGTPVNQFTQQDVLDGLVTFEHDDSNTAPTYKLIVQDSVIGGKVNTIPNLVGTVNFTAENDLPTFADLSTTFPIVTEGTPTPTVIKITNTIFDGSDEESGPAQLVYTIDAISEGSSFQSLGVEVTTFTQEDVNKGVVVFVHDGSEVPPVFTVTLSDSAAPTPGTVTQKDVTPEFKEVNDLPQLTANALTISEGETVTLGTTNLNATDIEDVASGDLLNLEFRINNIQNGSFELNGIAYTPESPFTLLQVIQGQVVFTHDGSSDAPSYEITVTDSDGDPSAPVPATVTFTAVNDAPILTVPTPAFVVDEGAIASLDENAVNAFDEDTPRDKLQFTVSNVVGGFFASINDTKAPINTFSQSLIDARGVVFVHDGSNTTPAYTLKVEDGAGGVATKSYTATLNAVNDVPTITVNQITLTEGDTVPITVANLQAKDEESGPADLTYTIDTLEVNGSFLLDGTTKLGLGATFTQQDVLDNRITFVHDPDSNEPPSYILTVTDGGINGGTGRRTSAPSTVTVNFTAINDAPEVVNKLPFAINQGGSFTLNNGVLLVQDEETTNPESLVYTVDQVSNGSFFLSGTKTTTFNQQDIDSGRVVFQHDGSELTPSYTVTVTDNGFPAPKTVSFSVDLAANFKNLNNAPTFLNNQLTIAEGGTVNFTTSNLSAKDAESSPLDLLFTVTKLDNGFFTLKNLGTKINPGETGTFTLKDVVEGQISFTHDGSNDAPTYTVTVADNGNPPGDLTTSKSTGPVDATIDFTATNDAPELIPDPALSPFTIDEGGIRALGLGAIDAQDEVGETPQSKLQFSVTNVQGGFFAKATDNKNAITTFSRADVAAGTLVFVHDNTDTAPSYTLTVTDEQGATDSAKYTATLNRFNNVPSFVNNTLKLTEGDRVTLTVDNLLVIDQESDSTELVFTIDSVSSNGQFIVDGANKGAGETFTLAQVEAGDVEFVHDKDSNDAPTYSLIVKDGDVNVGDAKTVGPNAAKITFTAINDEPEWATVTFPTINEGDNIAVTESFITAIDEESGAAQLVYKVSAISNAKFTLNGVQSDTFTQSDIDNNRVRFVHDGSENEPTFTLSLNDNGTPAPNVLTQDVAPAFKLLNNAPTFNVNQFSPVEGKTTTLTTKDLVAVDQEDADSALVFSIDQLQVAGGEFLLNGKSLGSSTFTRADLAFGRVTFKDDGDEVTPAYVVKVTDTEGDFTEAAATVVLVKVNDDPEIANSTFTLSEGGFLPITKTNLLTTDDETADPTQLTYTISALIAGKFFNDAATPITSFTQADVNSGRVFFLHDNSSVPPSFVVTAKDPDGGTASKAATIAFTGTNDAPIAADDQGPGFTTDESTPITTPILTLNDKDEENDPLTIKAIDGTKIAAGDTVTLANGAKVTLNANNSVIFDPNGKFETLSVDDSKSVSFEYTIADPTGDTDTATVTVVITGVNDAPDAKDDSGFGFSTTEEGVITTPSLLTNDSDIDANDVLVVSSIDTTGVRGTVTLNTNGTLTYDPTGKLDDLAQGVTFNEVITYTLSDGKGGIDTATVTIVVSGINDIPIAINDGGADFTTPEDKSFTTPNVLLNDKDADLDTLVIAAIDTTSTVGKVTNKNDGTFLYDPNGKFNNLTPGQTATDTFGYTVSDGKGGTATASVTITITGVNIPPVANDDTTPGFTTDEDTPVTLDVLANDTDLDGAGGLTITAVDVTGVQGKVTNNGTSLSYSPVGVLDYLRVGETLVETFTYTLTDAFGGTDTAQVKVVVTGVNDLPIATNDGGAGFTTNEDTAFTTISVLLTDKDIDSPTLTIFSIDTTNTKGLVTNNGNGTFTYDPNNKFNLLPQGGVGADSFTYTVSDGDGGQATATVSITIIGLVEVPNSFFDYEDFLLYSVPGAVLPTNSVGGLVLARFYDESFYLNNNPDVLRALNSGQFTSGFQHFVTAGLLEGRDPSILFNQDFYLSTNGDVANAVADKTIASGLIHFLTNGHLEGRDPSSFFDQGDYLTNNPDVAAAINPNSSVRSAFEHYINAGSDELRIPALELYNEQFYLTQNPDVQAAVNEGFPSGFKHFVVTGQIEGRAPSTLYNEARYLANNPDIAAAVSNGTLISGFQHFEGTGRFEGRVVF